MVGCCALVILLCLINPVPIDVHLDNIRDLLICAYTKGAAADHDLGFTRRPVMKTYGTGFIRCVAAIATNSIVVNKNVDLPPRDLNKMINLVNKSIQCGPVTAKVNTDLDGSVHAVASVGIAAQGTITPKAHRRGSGCGTERERRRHFVADRRRRGELSVNRDESQMRTQRFTEPSRGNAWSSPRQHRIPTNEIGLSDQERFHAATHKYAEYDACRAAEINVKLATVNLNNNQNELVHRYASSNQRHAAAADKGMRARDADECVIALRQAKVQVEAELKQAVAESKLTADQSNSSGRVPAGHPSKGKKAAKIAHGTV
ncbi:hypothetical protein B0H14DRAFT_2579972 [Mycena olivaceomarginata]|nr:hypothetical protein B0H14DRAFT_2579972 [Mycena olivaceomarginata]